MMVFPKQPLKNTKKCKCFDSNRQIGLEEVHGSAPGKDHQTHALSVQ